MAARVSRSRTFLPFAICALSLAGGTGFRSVQHSAAHTSVCDTSSTAGGMSPRERIEVSKQILHATNAARHAHGLARLRRDSRLTRAAELQAAQMAAARRMGHDLPEAELATLKDRVFAAGYGFTWAGENLAFDYRDAQSVVAGWLASPTHREVLLSREPVEVGAAVAFDVAGKPYYAIVFGRPQSMPALTSTYGADAVRSLQRQMRN
ncbi:MAG: CAP domain-containing protein [Gemmatimonadetes bacterium]|nr:CAP domain-containing protein [Gemmatimonadota bacterium]